MKHKLFPNLKKLTTIFTIAILCITVGILLMRLTFFSKKAPATSTSNSDTSSNTTSKTEKKDDLNINFGSKIVFDTAKANGSLKVKFPKDNNVAIRFKLIRNDTNREIYQSKKIPPGDKSLSIKLATTDIPAGEYACTLEITTYNLENDTKIETYNRDMTVIIKNNISA